MDACMHGWSGRKLRGWWFKKSIPKEVKLELNFEETARSRKGIAARGTSMDRSRERGKSRDTKTVFGRAETRGGVTAHESGKGSRSQMFSVSSAYVSPPIAEI